MHKKLLISLILLCCLATFIHAYDLKWRSPLTFSPASSSAGDTVTFTCRLKSGDGPSDSVIVQLRIGGSTVDSTTVAHLDTDETIDVSLTWTATEGTHAVEMIVDPDDAISGENQDNNIRMVTITVGEGSGGAVEPPPGYDLVWVGDISASPDSFGPGDSVTFSGTVQSLNGPSDSVLVRFLVDGVVVSNQTIAHLGTNGTSVVSFPWTAVAGEHTGTWVIDPLDTISGEDQSNNTLTESGTVEEPSPEGGGTEPTFDLRWTSTLSISPALPTTGSPITFSGDFKSFGRALRNVELILQVDGITVATSTIASVTSDTNMHVSLIWTTPTVGAKVAIMHVNQSPPFLLEPSVTNNAIQKSFTVKVPSRSISPIIPSNLLVRGRPLAVLLGEGACASNEDKTVDLEVVGPLRIENIPGDLYRKRLRIVIRNNGMKCVRSFMWELINQKDGQLIYRETASPLAGKRYALTQKIQRIFYVTIDRRIIRSFDPCEPHWCSHKSTIRAHVDPRNDIRESNEGNNFKPIYAYILWPKLPL